MIRVGYGSLSEYRPDEGAIDQPLRLGPVLGHIRDNFITLEVRAESHQLAFTVALDAIDSFLQHLSVSQNRLFEFKPLILQAKGGATYRVPILGTLASVTHYHVDSLRQDIEHSQEFCVLNDTRLLRALGYFEHALFLFEKRGEFASTVSRHFRYLIAAVFLNLWKSVTAIIGDPSVPKDGYQKRYREFGFDEDFRATLDRLKSLRDDYDVAHSTLDASRVDQVEATVGEAKNIAAEVIRKYRQHLIPRAGDND
jgi:hypothetical protein